MKAKDTRAKNADAVLDEVDALKAEFRREDDALVRAGRGREVLAKNVATLGIDLRSGERPRLITVNGVTLRS